MRATALVTALDQPPCLITLIPHCSHARLHLSAPHNMMRARLDSKGSLKVTVFSSAPAKLRHQMHLSALATVQGCRHVVRMSHNASFRLTQHALFSSALFPASLGMKAVSPAGLARQERPKLLFGSSLAAADSPCRAKELLACCSNVFHGDVVA